MRTAEKYATFDLRILEGKERRTISTQDALRDVTPVQWDESVESGEEKVTVRKPGVL